MSQMIDMSKTCQLIKFGAYCSVGDHKSDQLVFGGLMGLYTSIITSIYINRIYFLHTKIDISKLLILLLLLTLITFFCIFSRKEKFFLKNIFSLYFPLIYRKK